MFVNCSLPTHCRTDWQISFGEVVISRLRLLAWPRNWWLTPVILATQEDWSSKPAQANSSKDLILKNPITKNWAGGVLQDEGREFKPQYWKKTKRLLAWRQAGFKCQLVHKLVTWSWTY
jgi:hypothetical protein